MTLDLLGPELLRSTLTHDEILAIVIDLAGRGDNSIWHYYAHEELEPHEAIEAWAALIDAVRRKAGDEIDENAFWLVFRCTPYAACVECVQRKRGNIWPRLWSSSVRCMHHSVVRSTGVSLAVGA
jgi:hypothetical protein